MSFRITNTTVSDAVSSSRIATLESNKSIAFCNASICNLPIYFIYNSDTSGNVPGGANTVTSNYYATIPFDAFRGVRNKFYFDGNGYFYTGEPGYYRFTVSFDCECTDTDPSPHNVTLAIMNQSGGNDNLYFPFVLTGTSTHYSFGGVVPAAFYELNNYNNYPAEIHTAFESNETFTMKITGIHATASFLF